MEQETSNNLLMSLETASEKIEELEERRDRNQQKLQVRDNLIKELEGVIEELTEQVKRDQNQLAIAIESERKMRKMSGAHFDLEPEDQSVEQSDEGEGVEQNNEFIPVTIPMANFQGIARFVERKHSFTFGDPTNMIQTSNDFYDRINKRYGLKMDETCFKDQTKMRGDYRDFMDPVHDKALIEQAQKKRSRSLMYVLEYDEADDEDLDYARRSRIVRIRGEDAVPEMFFSQQSFDHNPKQTLDSRNNSLFLLQGNMGLGADADLKDNSNFFGTNNEASRFDLVRPKIGSQVDYSDIHLFQNNTQGQVKDQADEDQVENKNEFSKLDQDFSMNVIKEESKIDTSQLAKDLQDQEREVEKKKSVDQVNLVQSQKSKVGDFSQEESFHSTRRSQSLKNVAFLGLGEKSGVALKNAYDQLVTQEEKDKIMNQKFADNLEDADSSFMRNSKHLTKSMSFSARSRGARPTNLLTSVETLAPICEAPIEENYHTSVKKTSNESEEKILLPKPQQDVVSSGRFTEVER